MIILRVNPVDEASSLRIRDAVRDKVGLVLANVKHQQQHHNKAHSKTANDRRPVETVYKGRPGKLYVYNE